MYWYWYMHSCVDSKKIKTHFKCTIVSFIPHAHTHTHTHYTNVTRVLQFEIDDNFSNVKVRMTTNDA